MMTELSLNILDVAENSTHAGASLVEITVEADTQADRLRVFIDDDGCGMDEEQLARVEDPFFTTRKTRKVGLGIPFFKYAAISTGGSFHISSRVNKGTRVRAEFGLSHIDRMPLGDMNSTIYTLIQCHPETDFCYIYRYNGREFLLDTRDMKQILGDIPLNTPEVLNYIKEYLNENKRDVDGGAIL